MEWGDFLRLFGMGEGVEAAGSADVPGEAAQAASPEAAPSGVRADIAQGDAGRREADAEAHERVQAGDPIGELKARAAHLAQAGAYRDLLGELEAVTQEYPEFDLAAELEDEAFARLAGMGATLRQAYEAVHGESLREAAMEQAAQEAAARALAGFNARALRPREGALGGQGAFTTRKSVAHMTREERRALGRRAERGETIVF